MKWPGLYCEEAVAHPPVPAGALVRRSDAAEAGEGEALTGRWWIAAVGAHSSVKCVCAAASLTLDKHHTEVSGSLLRITAVTEWLLNVAL